MRKNVAELVATPRSWYETEFCTATTSTCMVSPMPTPKMNMYRASTQLFKDASIIDNKYAPSVIIAVPRMGKILYRPHRVTNRPDVTEAASIPSMTGRIRRPDAVGLTPFTSCMNSGRKVSAPNMASPITKPMALAALNTEARNSLSGMTGSSARCSTMTKPTARTTPSSAVRTLGAESQAHVIPPRLAKRIKDVADPASNAVPA